MQQRCREVSEATIRLRFEEIGARGSLGRSEDGWSLMAKEPFVAEVAKIAHFFGPEATGCVLTGKQYFRTCFE